MHLWDNAIQYLTALIAAAALFTTIIIYFKSRKTSSLSYSLLADTPLLTVSEEISGKLKIYYQESSDNEKQINDVSLIIIKLVNDGNLPIKPDDFKEPIGISLPPGVVVLTSEIIDKNPENLNPKIHKAKEEVVIESLLLNQKDYIKIKLLVTGYKHASSENISVNARIVGIDRIRNTETKKRKLLSSSNSNAAIQFSKGVLSALLLILVGSLTANMYYGPHIDVSPEDLIIQLGETGVSTGFHIMVGPRIIYWDDPKINLTTFDENWVKNPKGIELTASSNDKSYSYVTINLDPNVQGGYYYILIELESRRSIKSPSKIVDLFVIK